MMQDSRQQAIYRCGQYRIDTLRRAIFFNGERVPVTSKAFDVLVSLVENAGTVVTKDALLSAAWPDAIVEENNLTQQISILRRLFDDHSGDRSFIATVPGRGYCFAAQVLAEAGPSIEEESGRRPPTNTDAEGPSYGRHSFDRATLRGTAIAVAYVLIVLSVTLAFGSENAGRTRPHRSITVLNFRTLDPNDGRVVAGIQDTLRAKLGTLDDISVRPESLEPEAVDSLTAGRQLNVDIVLTGSVQQRNGRIRVAVEMVDVHAERIVWGKIFEDETSDLFDLQDSIASDVIRKLQEAVGRRISRNLNTSRPPFAASPEFAV